MIRFRSLSIVLIVAALAVCARAQGTTGGLLYASDFANWTLPEGNTPAQGAITYPNPDICKVTSNGYTFLAPKVGRPITIVDGVNTETVTPTTVTIGPSGCTISAVMAHSHSSYFLKSGTAGGQEAVDYQASQPQGANIILTPAWTQAGGTTGIITGTLKGNTGATILDQRTAVITPYGWNGSNYVPQAFIGGVTASPQFSLFYQPNSGTQAAAVGDPHVTTDGNGHMVASSVTVAGVPTTGTVSGQTATCLPKASGASALTAASAVCDNGSTVTATEPIIAPSAQASVNTQINPMSAPYGAKCDVPGQSGGTNDTVALQAAVDACAAQGGGEVLIPGHCKGHVVLKPSCALVGQNNHPAAATAGFFPHSMLINDACTAGTSAPVVDINGNTNPGSGFAVRDIGLLGCSDATGTLTADIGIRIQGAAHRVFIERNSFAGFGQQAIYNPDETPNPLTIKDNFAENSLLSRTRAARTGVFHISGNDSWVERNEVTASSNAVITNASIFNCAIFYDGRTIMSHSNVGELSEAGICLGPNAGYLRSSNDRADQNGGHGWYIDSDSNYGENQFINDQALNNSRAANQTYDDWHVLSRYNNLFMNVTGICDFLATCPQYHFNDLSTPQWSGTSFIYNRWIGTKWWDVNGSSLAPYGPTTFIPDSYMLPIRNNTVSIGQKTTPTSLRLYNILTDVNNFSSLDIAFVTGFAKITPSAGGTGVETGLQLCIIEGTICPVSVDTSGDVNIQGPMWFNPDNTYPVGVLSASGVPATRPSYVATAGGVFASYFSILYPANTVSSTALNTLVCGGDSGGYKARGCTITDTTWIGVSVGGANLGTGGNTEVAVAGTVSLIFDGTTVINDYIQISTVTNRFAHDAGATYPTTGCVVGFIESVNSGAGTAATVQLFSPGTGCGRLGVGAQADQAGLSANTSGTLLASAAAGTYQAMCYVVLTTAATSSSTLPNCAIGWTDLDTSVVASQNLTNTRGSNTVGDNSNKTGPATPGIFQAKAATAITWSTGGYVSSGVTPMQYAIHVKLVYLGP